MCSYCQRERRASESWLACPPVVLPQPDAGNATDIVVPQPTGPSPSPTSEVKTLRVYGSMLPEVWNRLGVRLIPKLRSGTYRSSCCPRGSDTSSPLAAFSLGSLCGKARAQQTQAPPREPRPAHGGSPPEAREAPAGPPCGRGDGGRVVRERA
jgi:hypothetical protein